MMDKAYFFESLGNALQRREVREMRLTKMKGLAGRGGNPPRR